MAANIRTDCEITSRRAVAEKGMDINYQNFVIHMMNKLLYMYFFQFMQQSKYRGNCNSLMLNLPKKTDQTVVMAESASSLLSFSSSPYLQGRIKILHVIFMKFFCDSNLASGHQYQQVVRLVQSGNRIMYLNSTIVSKIP